MARKKGTPKTGGRSKGTPNKTTGELKQWVQELIDGNRSQLEKDMKTLDPHQRWKIIEKLMSYTIPKMQNVQANIDLAQLSDEQIDNIVNNLLKSIENENKD